MFSYRQSIRSFRYYRMAPMWFRTTRAFCTGNFKSKDYYTILGLPEKCSINDIKVRFRELALLHHPDRNQGKVSENFFKIQEAYLVLSDPKTRMKYDMFANINQSSEDQKKPADVYREQYMTEEEKKVYKEQKERFEVLMKTLIKDHRQKAAELNSKKDLEFERSREFQRTSFENARQEVLKQMEYLSTLDEKFREQLQKDHKQMLLNHEDMVQNLKMKQVDLDNYAGYIEEFYNKSWVMYGLEYEMKLKEYERLNEELDKKRTEYEIYKDQAAPQDDILAKREINHDKMDAYKNRNENVIFTKIESDSKNSKSSSMNMTPFIFLGVTT